MTTTTPSPSLPPGHAAEIVRPGSRFLDQLDYVTRQPIQVGQVVVVCHQTPAQGVVTVEAWRESVPQCPYCQAYNPGFGLPPVSPPTYKDQKGAAIPTIVAPPGSLPDAHREPERRSSPVLLLIAGVAILVVALIFMALSGGGVETSPPPTATATSIVVIVPTEPPPPPPTHTPTPTPLPPPPPPPPEPPEPEPPEPELPEQLELQAASPISEMALYDAGRDYTVLTLSDGGTIDLSQVGTTYLNIVARTTTPVGSIKFLLDGVQFCKNGRCIENAPPYSMAGDVDGNFYNNWDWSEMVGSHTVQIIPYSGANAGGEELPGLTLRFTVVP